MENVSTKYLVKKVIESKLICEEELSAKPGWCIKIWIKTRNQENNPQTLHHVNLSYQLTIKNLNRKVDYLTGGKWFIHGPKHRKENQLLILEHPRWLSSI